MKRILITGGAGFIGFHLAKHLLQDNQNEVVIIDNLQRGRLDQDLQDLLDAYPTRLRFEKRDLTDPKSFETMDRDFDQIYHLAAVNGTKHFYRMPHEVLHTDIFSLFYLLEWIAKLEKKPKLCFTSTCEAYAGALEAFGQLPLPTPENVPLVVSDVYNPRWSYAGTKIIGEQAVIHYASHYQFPALILRPHNFYGPREGYDHVIPEFCLRILAKQDPFPMNGGDQTRNFCYIGDAVVAMQRLMDSPTTDAHPVEIVHVGSDEETPIRDVAEHLFRASGWRPASVEENGAPSGSVKRRVAQISKVKRLIDWEPTTPLAEGIAKTLEWYREHPKSD